MLYWCGHLSTEEVRLYEVPPYMIVHRFLSTVGALPRKLLLSVHSQDTPCVI